MKIFAIFFAIVVALFIGLILGSKLNADSPKFQVERDLVVNVADLRLSEYNGQLYYSDTLVIIKDGVNVDSLLIAREEIELKKRNAVYFIVEQSGDLNL